MAPDGRHARGAVERGGHRTVDRVVQLFRAERDAACERDGAQPYGHVPHAEHLAGEPRARLGGARVAHLGAAGARVRAAGVWHGASRVLFTKCLCRSRFRLQFMFNSLVKLPAFLRPPVEGPAPAAEDAEENRALLAEHTLDESAVLPAELGQGGYDALPPDEHPAAGAVPASARR